MAIQHAAADPEGISFGKPTQGRRRLYNVLIEGPKNGFTSIKERPDHRCSHCGAGGHDADAAYCRICGTLLKT